MNPNPSQTPVVETLSEEQLAKIEARALEVKELVGVGQFGEDMLRLCQSLRAARAEIRGIRRGFPEWAAEWDGLKRTLRESENENAALREKLDQAGTDRESFDAALGAELDRNIALHERTVSLERQRNEALDQCTELHQRISEAERPARNVLETCLDEGDPRPEPLHDLAYVVAVKLGQAESKLAQVEKERNELRESLDAERRAVNVLANNNQERRQP